MQSLICKKQISPLLLCLSLWFKVRLVLHIFQARRALRALKAVVRLQAIFRGWQVRKQAALTLRCMQALVRAQATVRARNSMMSPHGKAVHNLLDNHQIQAEVSSYIFTSILKCGCLICPFDK